MTNSRTKNSALTLATGGIRQILTLIFAFASRTVFIYTLGAEYLGLNGLFSNILSILALSELGIGGAIAFYLYKPLVDKNIERIKVLMKFYRRCYNYVGLSILIFGCTLMPFLHLLINLEQQLPENIYLIYFLFLLQNAGTYFFFAYKQTLVAANQELYKIEKLNILFTFVNCLTDVVILLIFRDFIVYLVVKLLLVIIKNVVISNKIDREYPYLKESCDGKLSREEIHKFLKDLYSLSIFRLGSTLFNTLSNLIISIMIGTVVVGYYSNYFMITSQVSVIYFLLITSLTAGVGNVIAKETKEKQIAVFHKLSLLTFFAYSFCSICLFQLINSFVNLWLGGVNSDYVLTQSVVFFVCLNFYIDTSCQLEFAFRNANGYFKTGRYLQVIGGVVNICLAIPLCKMFGLTGLFAAQVIAKVFTTYFPFLFNVEKQMFGFSKWYVFKQWFYKFSFTIITSAMIWGGCIKLHQTTLLNFAIEAGFTVMFIIISMILIYRKTPAYVEIVSLVKTFFQSR